MSKNGRRFTLAAAAAVMLGTMIGLAAASGDAFAHTGGLASDGCHNHKAAGERHWHIDGTSERGGECIKRDGRTVKVRPPAAIDHVEVENLRLLVEGEHDWNKNELRTFNTGVRFGKVLGLDWNAEYRAHLVTIMAKRAVAAAAG